MQTNGFGPCRPSVRAIHARSGLAYGGLYMMMLLPLAAAAGQGDNSPVTLRMKFKQGDVTRYQMTMQTTSTGTMSSTKQDKPTTTPASMNIVTEQKVTRALPNGGDVTLTFLSMKMIMNGKSGSIMQNMPPPMSMAYDARGNIVSVQGRPIEGGNAMGSIMAGTGLTIVLPANAVKPGDSWSAPVNMGPSSGTTQSTFVKMEAVGRYRTARIHSTTILPMHLMLDQARKPTKQAANAMMTITGTTSMTTDINFAIAEGKIVRMNGTLDQAMTTTYKQGAHLQPPGMSGPMTTSSKMIIATTILP